MTACLMTLQEKALLDHEEARVVEKQNNYRTRQLAQERDDAGKRREARARKVKCDAWTITRVELTYGFCLFHHHELSRWALQRLNNKQNMSFRSRTAVRSSPHPDFELKRKYSIRYKG